MFRFIPHHCKIVSDLKPYNVILGLMECGSRHDCYICKALKHSMGIWERAELGRIEDLIEDFAHWEEETGLRNNITMYRMFLFCRLQLQSLSTMTIQKHSGSHSHRHPHSMWSSLTYFVKVNHLWKGVSKLELWNRILKSLIKVGWFLSDFRILSDF